MTGALIDYGQVGGSSAMSRTVALPAAIACRLILENRLSLTGIQIPVRPELYDPVLDELEKLGIAFKEEKHPL